MNFKRPRPRCLVGPVAGQPGQPDEPVRRSWSWGQGRCLGPIWPVPDGRLRVARPRSIGLTLAFGRRVDMRRSATQAAAWQGGGS